MNIAYAFFKCLFKIFYRLLFRYRVYGHAHVPAAGGVIIAANHLSFLDPPLVGIALKRRATYMARRGLFSLPLVGTFVRTFSFPVDREGTRPSTIKEAVSRLRRGEIIVMFPEGSRSAGGDISAGKRGIAAIAAMSGATVIPTLIRGTDRALPVGAKFIRPSHVSVTFGPPLHLRERESDREFQKRVANDIMEEIRRLKGFHR